MGFASKIINELTSSRWKPARRLTFLLTYLFTSYIFYSQYEGWSFFQITFFIVVTISTLGYAAPVPTDDNSRLFTIFFIFIGVAIIFTVFTAVASRGINALERYCCKKKRDDNIYQIDDLHHKKTLYLAVFYIFICVTGGAIFFKKNEGWSWIESFYFAVQTSTSVGYGDLTTSHSTHIFLLFYVVLSVIFVTYAIKSFGSVMEHERLLKERRQILKQMQSLDFIAELNEGKGVAKHEFVLAILTHLGVLNAEQDVDPWMKKFDEFDSDNSGVLTKAELQNFFVQEAQESQQVLQQMAERQKVLVLSELLEDSRMSIMETVIPFVQGTGAAAGGGGDVEEGRGSMSFSLFRGSLPNFRRGSATATTTSGTNDGDTSGGGVGMRGSTVNPINRGGPNAIRSPIKRTSTTPNPDIESGGASGGMVELEDFKNRS